MFSPPYDSQGRMDGRVKYMNLKTSKEGVTVIFDQEGEVCGIIYKDMKSRKNVFYKCEEMSMSDLEKMIGSDIIKTKPVEITE